ncbi:2OG-Fe(II) oxygenase family protein [Enterobacter sp. C4G1]|uniref:2OG-Fe(II) oxygenase family protein n=1 Tax=Enterobacter sp. C4G1 TaxID=3458724 RepID=UPI004067B768
MEWLKEIAPGIVSANMYSPKECADIIFSANQQADQWMKATVSEFDDVKGKKEILDTFSRNGLVKSHQQLPSLCAKFELIANDLFSQVLRTKWSLPPLTLEDTQLVRYSPGGFFKKHTDWGRSHPQRCISLALYLNDEYEGGCLEFPLLDVRHKPTTGECIAFPSDYLHSGEPVIEGEKYVFLSFMCGPKPIF